MHTRRDIYLAITDQIEPHPNLNFSIKYGAGDFHRLTVFNPTLGVGKHNYIVEFQGQPEYYGKGAHPIYVAKGMIDGWEEFDQINPEGRHRGVRELLKDPKMKGLWTWSRGGGWRGPYLKNEMWSTLKAQHPSCATLYEPLAFGMNEKGVYGKLKGSLKESIDAYRLKLKL